MGFMTETLKWAIFALFFPLAVFHFGLCCKTLHNISGNDSSTFSEVGLLPKRTNCLKFTCRNFQTSHSSRTVKEEEMGGFGK